MLREVAVFSTGADGQLRTVLTAASARPEPGTNFWLIKGGRLWVDGSSPPALAVDVSTIKSEARADLGLNQLWVSNLDINPVYLSQAMLRSLAGSANVTFDPGFYWMLIQVRYADWILPGAMILLASSMSLFFLRHGSSFGRVMVLALTGYVVHVALRAVSLLGGHGYVPPVMVAWFVPCVLLTTALVTLVLAHALGTGEKLPGAVWRLFGQAPRRSHL